MFALLFITLYLSTRYAHPLPQFINTRSPNHHCEDPSQCRTVWNILQSCLTTVLACTWVAVHMNIPGPDDSLFTKTMRRIGVMGFSLIAPELIVTLAMQQWFAAGRYAEQYKEYGWTRTHGFFAIMGGFILYDGDQPVRTLKPEDLRPYLESHEIDITEEEIKDKSKGDILSKGVVLVQTGWFILQCIARRIERLPITELEIATLAFAALNFATYVLWLDKPLNVQCAVPLRRRLSFTGDTNVQGGDSFSHRIVTKSGIECVQNAIQDFAWDMRVDGFWRAFKIKMQDGIDRVVVGDGEVEMRASTFYTGDTGDSQVTVLFMGMAFATLFGGIHCIPWSFHFPTLMEQLLWRISSVAISSYPIFAFILAMCSLFTFILYTTPFLYPFPRLVLLVISFTSLRSLPSEAYQTVRWTTFIPHL